MYQVRIRRAIRKANTLRRQTGYKYIVLNVAGKPKVFARFQLKRLIKLNFFAKGVNIRQLEKHALYITA
jgi:hypothetical protein